MLTLSATHAGQPIAVEVRYDKAIWSGLSWAVGEIPCDQLKSNQTLTVRATSSELMPMTLTLELWHID